MSVLIAATALGAFFVTQRAPSGASEVVTAVSQSAPVTGATAKTTVEALTAPGAPLSTVRQVGSGLSVSHSTAQCDTDRSRLATVGTPTSLRELAAAVADPVAADLAGDLVTAESAVLAGCSSASGPSQAALTELGNCNVGLDARVKEDAGA